MDDNIFAMSDHIHDVIDTGAHFVIDPVTRKILYQGVDRVTLVQHDHNSERITIELPRYIDGHDMLTCNIVQLHYTNASSDGQNKYEDMDTITDLHVIDGDEETLCCTWLVPGEATQYVGTLCFSLKFMCSSDDSTICYGWGTQDYTDIVIADSTHNTASVVARDPDVIAQHEARIQTLETQGGPPGPQGETGPQGPQGVGVTKAEINEAGELVITLSNGDVFNLGVVVGSDGRDGLDAVSIASVASGIASDGSGILVEIVLTDGSQESFIIPKGNDGESVTVSSVNESTEDGGSNVVTFSDGNKMIVRNGKTGSQGPKGADYVLTDADKSMISTQAANAAINRGNPLYGKRLACCGDSVMESRTDETSPQFNGGAWSAIIGERNSMTVENRGRGGSTLCNYYYKDTGTYSNSHTINRQIELIGDADYVIFNGWVNDFHRNEVIGEITSGYGSEFNKDTILGGLEFICYTLSTKFAGKKYGYLFNHRSYYDTAEQSNVGTKLHLKRQMKKVLEKWGVPYLDLENMIPSLYFIPSLRALYTGEADGVHPNKEGYELFYCDKIEAWMKNALGYANLKAVNETTYNITVSTSPENGGAVTGGNTYEDGAQVTVTATANNGYKFVKWTENGAEVSSSATYTFTARKDTSLVAVFEEIASEPEEPTPSYTNLVPTSINAYGTQYGWDQDGDGEIDPEYIGFKLGARLSSSGVEKSAGLYSLITGFMPVVSGATVRAKGANISLAHANGYICVYDSNFTYLGGMAMNGTDYDTTNDVIGDMQFDTENDMATFKLNDVSSIAYVRINSAGDGSTSQVGNTLIVTVNEEII